jgi:predicted RNase H-like HicB family nuclease
METKSLTYSLTIERHDDGFLAFFPALPGCNTWGITFQDAVKNAEEALTVYLDTLTEHGDPIPEELNQQRTSLGVTVRSSVIH